MEPGDLRINSRLRDDSGVPKNSPGNNSYANEGNSVLHFRSHVRPPVITDGRMHHISAPIAGAPLVIDRNEPVKIWRDPILMNSGEIRKLHGNEYVSMQQHPGVVHLPHPMVAHGNVNTSVYQQQHHENKAMDTSTNHRGAHLGNADSLRGRTPVSYASPHPPQSNAKQPPDGWQRQGVLQNPKDFRVNLTAKSTVEQAVHDHFVASLRLAQMKGNEIQQPQQAPSGMVKQEERPSSHGSSSQVQQRYYPPPHDKRHHEVPNPQQVIYQIHQHQQQQQQQHQSLTKAELPTPPPLRSEPQYHRTGNNPEVSSRKHQIYGPPEVISRPHDTIQQQQQQQHQQQQQQQQHNERMRYEQEAMSRLEAQHPSDNCVRYQKLPPAPSRRPPTQTQNDLQLERNRSPFGKHAPPSASPNSYHHPSYSQQQAHISKHKVNSPAPSHIYGKPGPSTRPYEISNDPAVPLPLTSKGGLTRPSQSSPSQTYLHASASLPQHEVRQKDVAYYMYHNGPPGYQPSLSPQQHLHSHSIQTQPLDLGGKRKVNEEESIYKGPITATDYQDHHSSIKSAYGSRKPADDPRPKLPPHNHHNHMNSHVPLSLTVSSEVPSKRKFEDAAPPLHIVDTKKVRSEGTAATSGTSNLMIARKDHHDIKPTIADYAMDATLYHNTRHYIDNPPAVPISLIVSGCDNAKPKLEATTSAPSPKPLQLDVKKPLSIKSSATDPLPLITPATSSSSSSPSSLCNGKHKESISTNVETTNSTLTLDKKPEIDNTAKVKAEPVATSAPATTSSLTVSPSPSTSTNTSSPTPTKFQKVPKKAWVLQWHEGDSAKANEDPVTTNEPGTSGTGESSSSSKSVTPSTGDTVGSTEDKLPNGNILANSDNERKAATPTPVAATTTVNGFGKDRPNDSDLCSENESDTSGKDKALTDSSSSTPKKNGRKGKGGGSQAASPNPKADLRKDGLCKRPPVTQLKKTGDSFIQAETCNRVTPKIGKCRECRWHPSGRGSKKQTGAYCRFYGFRKLRYTKGGSLSVAGFSDPFSDPPKITEHDQFRLWLPSKVAPEGLDATMSKFLLSQLCDQFCDLVHHEEAARVVARTQETKKIAWKPLLKGVMEMCDVCDTTLFNFHWACAKCGFVVCLSCFKARQNECEKVGESGKDRDEYQWLLCSNRCVHELDKLMLVQTIAGDALAELNKNVHSVCSSWKISQNCNCNIASELSDSTSDNKDSLDAKNKTKTSETDTVENTTEPVSENKSENLGTENGEDTTKPSVLPTNKKTALESPASSNIDGATKNEEKAENGCSRSSDGAIVGTQVELKYFKRLKPTEIKTQRTSVEFTPFTSTEISDLCPNVKHGWLCDGKLLQLLEPPNPENTTIFREIWKRGHPVLVSNVTDKLDKTLWTPESFSNDFGEYKNDVVNYVTNDVTINQQMKKFWEGFTSANKRIRDDKGEPLLLKLKDWTLNDDLGQTLPSRFQDLMAALPMPDYTLREGQLNLVTRLPPEFMRPDLGPKMYIAYGSGSSLNKGTTNLHLDIADVVNVLIYCEGPHDADKKEHDKAIAKAIEESDCDVVTKNRVLQKKRVPGALWHIYEAKDADKIRDLLNKVAIEKGEKIEPHHDPIYDQSWYLDKSLRTRLRTEYSVNGYSILQCTGDAIFIPAGAPHQVRNLQNCIKVAEDFVSPESISHSLALTVEEFHSQKNKTHTRNNEDKLQIKNVVYHAVKDALTVLLLQNNEKSDVHKNTSKNDALVASTALSKDCQPQPSTSPKEPTPAVVNPTTNN